VNLVNYLPDVEDPNEAIVARLFAHGGLSHAERGGDGVYRQHVRIPPGEYIWQPAIIVMKAGGELELDFRTRTRSHTTPSSFPTPATARQ
jgi:PQQ system protein